MSVRVISVRLGKVKIKENRIENIFLNKIFILDINFSHKNE